MNLSKSLLREPRFSKGVQRYALFFNIQILFENFSIFILRQSFQELLYPFFVLGLQRYCFFLNLQIFLKAQNGQYRTRHAQYIKLQSDTGLLYFC